MKKCCRYQYEITLIAITYILNLQMVGTVVGTVVGTQTVVGTVVDSGWDSDSGGQWLGQWWTCLLYTSDAADE